MFTKRVLKEISNKKTGQDQAERMRAIAAEKMAENLEIMKRRVEEKHAEAEARMNQQAAKAAHRVNQIRRTGRIPSSYKLCCSGRF